jgi:hypothetical protein
MRRRMMKKKTTRKKKKKKKLNEGIAYRVQQKIEFQVETIL